MVSVKYSALRNLSNWEILCDPHNNSTIKSNKNVCSLVISAECIFLVEEVIPICNSNISGIMIDSVSISFNVNKKKMYIFVCLVVSFYLGCVFIRVY